MPSCSPGTIVPGLLFEEKVANGGFMKQALVTRHSSLVTLLAISLLPALITPAQAADNYPSRPVRMIVPYPPGGGSDLTGRTIAQKLTDSLGQTIVVDNRPGATGLIGTELAAKAPLDGYTIILADAPHTINALVYTRQRYDAIRDFEPINLVATSPQGLFAHPSFKLNTLKEL